MPQVFRWQPTDGKPRAQPRQLPCDTHQAERRYDSADGRRDAFDRQQCSMFRG